MIKKKRKNHIIDHENRDHYVATNNGMGCTTENPYF